MAYRYFKDLPRSTPSDKKSLCEIMTNQLLAEKLHKPTIKNL